MSGVVSPQVAALAPTIGREAELANLRLSFNSTGAAPVVRVLVGMGGVGKTSLARAFAQRHLDDYGIVWWVRAEDPVAIDAEFRALLEILLSPGEANQVRDARTVAFAHLAKQDTPWLLVLDNVPDPDTAHGLLPPAGRGHVLITSRSTIWPNPTTIRPLDMPAAVELLTTWSGDGDKTAAETLAEELGGLPLALAQAAGFARSNRVDLATYLRLYRERSAELHQDGRPADYPHTVATTWQLAIDRLSEKAREMLNVLAFYAPDAIPVQLLFKSWDELTRLRAVGDLNAYSLITPTKYGDRVTVHRLVQAVTRNRLHADLTSHEWANISRQLIMTALPEAPVTAVGLATWNTLRTHVLALLGHVSPEHPETLATRHSLARWTGESGDPTQARDLFAELLPIRERVLGAEHPNTLITRHSFARWTGQAGDAARARDLYAELLLIRQRVLGVEHPDTLSTQNNLALLTGEAGEAARARDLFAELLPIRQRVFGDNHPQTLLTRHNVARWTGMAGDAARARDLFAELLPIRRRVLGEDHPDILTHRHRLAFWTGMAGDAAQARDLFAELLPIRSAVLGPEYPRTLATHHELAYWTGQAGDAVRAQELFAELLPVRERVMGPEHPDTVKTRKELARLGVGEETGPGGGGEGEGGASGVLGVADGGD